jgi:aspartate-semialdehyde dehydrogenase
MMSAFRHEDDVPIAVPGVNLTHGIDRRAAAAPRVAGFRRAVAEPAFPVSATCTRTAVTEGHTEAAAVSLGAGATPAEVAAAFREFTGDLGGLDLPSAPQRLITVHDDPFRPQPRLDRDADGGMTTSVGRIRDDPALEHGVKYVLVSHNARMGAAKGAVLTASIS